MKDLGYTPPESKKEPQPVTISDDSEKGRQYPSLRFNGEQAEKAGLANCRFGEVYEFTIRAKATSIGGENYPGSGNTKDSPAVVFDVIACDEPEEIESPEEDTDEDEEEEYDRPKDKIELGPGKDMK